jgi:uncharacterized protein
MKKTLSLFLLLFIGCISFGQATTTIAPVKEKKPEEQVRQYFFVMLTKGSNRNHDSAGSAKIQEGHMANIRKLYYEGKLKVAGPFGDDGDWRGIFIFDCATKEEVEQLLKTDPAVAAGRLAYEIHPWWTASTGSFVAGKPEKKN